MGHDSPKALFQGKRSDYTTIIRILHAMRVKMSDEQIVSFAVKLLLKGFKVIDDYEAANDG